MSPEPSPDIRIPTTADWDDFDLLTAAEGWRVPAVEKKLFRSIWTDCAGALIHHGRFCGLVTAVAHEKNGWIGNLIVPPEMRGQGHGRRLFRWSVETLREAGLSAIWLTASEQGRPLYEKEGFRAVDRIERWVLKPKTTVDSGSAEEDSGLLAALDRKAWGEDRGLLLEALRKDGQIFSVNDTTALLLQEEQMQIIGPWYSADLCPRSNRLLLQKLLAAADPASEIVIDLLGSTPVRSLVAAAGFHLAGETVLMAYGKTDQVALKSMVALASLGSVG